MRVGAGGGGFVHRATWRARPGEADVALKVFRAGGTVTDGDPRHEIALGPILHHPNVIRVLGASSAPRLGLDARAAEEGIEAPHPVVRRRKIDGQLDGRKGSERPPTSNL